MRYATIIIMTMALLFGACSTFEQREPIDRIAGTLESAAFVGTAEILLANPGYENLFADVVAELTELENRPTVDYDRVIAILRRLPVSELSSPRAILYVESTRLLLQSYGEPSVDLGEKADGDLITMVAAIRRGMERGMAW